MRVLLYSENFVFYNDLCIIGTDLSKQLHGAEGRMSRDLLQYGPSPASAG